MPSDDWADVVGVLDQAEQKWDLAGEFLANDAEKASIDLDGRQLPLKSLRDANEGWLPAYMSGQPAG